MNKLYLVFVSLLMAYLSYGQTNGTDPIFVDGHLYVKVKNESTINLMYNGDPHLSILRFTEQFGIQTIEQAFNIESETLSKIYKVKFDSIPYTDSLISAFLQLDFIEYAEKIAMYKSIANDEFYANGTQWCIDHVAPYSPDCIWEDIPVYDQNTKIKIAIVDDAVNINHPDLIDNIWVNTDETLGSNGVDDDNNGYVDDINGWDAAEFDNDPNPGNSEQNHGTHVAGIAGASTNNSGIGMASITNNKVEIIAVKTTTDIMTDGYITNGYDGVIYAIAAGADIINMSWGASFYSDALQDIMNEAHQRGIVLVAGSGNYASFENFYPACYEHVISVGATDMDDKVTVFSNYGQHIDVMAPGWAIYSTVQGGYEAQHGTSMASPLVAGICGVMLAYSPSSSPEQIETALEGGCLNIDAVPGNDAYFGLIGAGRVRLCEAINLLQDPPVAVIGAEYEYLCAGMTVSFTDESTGNPATSRTWDVDGGASFTDNGSSIEVNFTTNGTYTISLEVTNDYGTSSTDYTVEVQDIEMQILNTNLTDLCLETPSYAYIELQGTPPFKITYNDGSGSGDQEISGIPSSPYAFLLETSAIGNYSVNFSQFEDAFCINTNVNQSIQYNVVECEGCDNKQYNHWYFGNKAGISFNSGAPVPLSDSQMNQTGGSASISTPDGNLLFYTNGVTVWNREHNIMLNGEGLLGHLESANSALIVPHPSDNTEYFLFTMNSYQSNIGIHYSKVKFQIDAGGNYNLGEVELATKNTEVHIDDYLQEGMTMVPGDNGSIWVLAHDRTTAIGTQGKTWIKTKINYDGSVEDAELQFIATDTDFQGGLTTMKASPSGNLVAVNRGASIGLYSFDSSDGKMTLTTTMTLFEWGYGFEFSPNERYLYVSTIAANNYWLYQYDLQADDVAASRYTILDASTYIYPTGSARALQLGPDNRIYFARLNTTKVGVIANPNEQGDDLIVVSNAVPLGLTDAGDAAISTWGLPNYVDYYNIRALVQGTDISCYGESDGTAEAIVTGFNALPPYSYQWDDANFSTTASVSNLPAGTYNVTVTDANNCKVVESITILEPEAISLDNVQITQNIDCLDENLAEAVVAVSGGAEDYTYNWTGAGPGASYLNSNMASGLNSGMHYVTITDENGCFVTADINVTEIATTLLEVDIEDVFMCEPCEPFPDNPYAYCIDVPIDITGGTPSNSFTGYQINTGGDGIGIDIFSTTRYYQPIAGNYSVTVTDDNGCQATENFSIVFSDLAVNTSVDACGTSATLNAANGISPYTYQWSNDNGFSSTNSEITLYETGMYYYTVTDANNCSVTGELDIQNIPTEPVTQTVFICTGQSIQLCATLGNTYLWDNAATTACINVNQLGTYTCTSTDAAGCSWTEVFEVQAYDDALIYATPKCDQSINPNQWLWQLEVQGDLANQTGTTYLWSDGQTINPIEVSQGTDYSVTVSNGGCQQVLSHQAENIQILPTALQQISSDETILNGVWLVPEPILVEAGATLYLKYAQLIMMFDHGAIDIEAKGKVKNYGTKITACSTWKGITVKGKPTGMPSPSYQGYYYSSQGAEIHHAQRAINAIDGGMYSIKKSKFFNNLESVYCSNYTISNSNHPFKYNEIRVDNNNRFSPQEYYPSNPNEIKYQMTFKNLKYHGDVHLDIVNENTQGIKVCGLYAKGCRIGIVPTNNARSRLENLDIGIKHLSGIVQGSKLVDTDVINTRQGVHFDGEDNLEITGNTFDMNGINHPESFGLFVNTGLSPEITLNTFKNGARGLLLNQTSGEYLVYKNTFKNFTYNPNNDNYLASAIVSTGDNTVIGSNNLEGVQFKCNDFNNNHKSIAVKDLLDTYGSVISQGKVRKRQGYWDDEATIQDPANNLFDGYCLTGSNEDAFYVQSSSTLNYTYFFHLTYVPIDVEVMDFVTCHSSNVTKSPAVAPTGVTYDAACPDEPNSGGGDNPCPPNCDVNPFGASNLGGLSTGLFVINAEIESKEEILSMRIDQGRTEVLASKVNTASTSDYTEVAQKVAKNRGMVSDLVLDEFMLKDVGRPVAKTIALAKNSPLPEKAKAKISEAGLPDDLKAYLNSKQNGKSIREQKESEIAKLKSKKQHLINRFIAKALKDSSDATTDSLLLLIDIENDFNTRRQVIGLLASKGRTNETLDRIATLRQDIVHLEEAEALDDILAVKALKIEAATKTESEKEAFYSSHNAALWSIYHKKGKAATMAYHLLKGMGEDLDYPLDITTAFPTENLDRSTQWEAEPVEASTHISGWLSLYPNPVEGILTVEYLLDKNANTQMSVYDISGKLLISENLENTMGIKSLNVSQLKAGVYILKLDKHSKEFVVK